MSNRSVGRWAEWAVSHTQKHGPHSHTHANLFKPSVPGRLNDKMATPAHTATEFESFLYQAGMKDNDAEREALADALADSSIGITSVETVASWNMAALTCTGADFVAAMTDLVTKVRAVVTNIDGHPRDEAAKSKLVAAIRTALLAEEGV